MSEFLPIWSWRDATHSCFFEVIMYRSQSEHPNRFGLTLVGSPLRGQTSVKTRKRILLADDDALFRACLRIFLSDHYEVCCEAADGQEAIEKAIEHRPDVALLNLPVRNGLEAAREIRRSIEGCKLVMLSHHDLSDRETHAKSLCDAVVSKSNGTEALMVALHGLFRPQL